ncbi:unnamed protein product [Prunus armeniaca]|uniref:Uncharacterized protein n=1 Tax=Prunus armeniaca TaxID=36596 RepID=A0A6J5UYT3_PRUAR|nr:unnamed protein product [Prunus armeniaca]CAB4312135.1 unnamed protein product [Prunus armeniaca]
MNVEKGKNIIDNGGVFSPSIIRVKSCHNSNNLWASTHSLFQKRAWKGRKLVGQLKLLTQIKAGVNIYRGRLRLEQPNWYPHQSELNTVQLEIDTKTRLAGLPRQFQRDKWNGMRWGLGTPTYSML